MSDNGEGPGNGRNFPVIYSQQAMVGVSFYDFSLVFFQESYKGTDPVANIALPPAAAKQLARTLQEYVEAYEENFGEIPLPPEEPEEDEEYEDDEGDEDGEEDDGVEAGAEAED